MDFLFRFFPFWLLPALTGSLLAQPPAAVLKGRVRDARSLEPLSFAPLVFGRQAVVSDAGGFFRLTAAENTDGWVRCRYPGYAPDSLRWSAGIAFLDFRLLPTGKDMAEVVVSGTLRQTGISESPVPVEVYKAGFFQKNPSPGLFESLAMINGVQPRLSCAVCNSGDIRINGMDGPYTLVLIDGMPIVSALSTVYGLSGIPMGLIRRIEVVKGPASALYGSEAMGGLINIITRDPLSAPRLQAEAFSTSWLEHNLDAGASRSFRNAHTLLGINGFWFGRPVDNNGDGFTDASLQKRFSVFNKWDFVRRGGREAGLAIRYVHENRWGGQTGWTRAERGLDRIYGENILTRRAELTGSWQLPFERSKIRLQYSWNYHFQNSWYGTMWYKGGQQTAFAQLLWDKKKGRHDFTAGIPFRFVWYDDNTSGTFSGPGQPPGNRPSLTWLPGIFFQDEWSRSDRFSLLSGLRFDYHNRHGMVWSPRIGIRYRPSPDHTLRFSSGNGFRVVNLFAEDHAALSGARQVIVSGDLRPERSWNANLSYNTQIDMPSGYLTADAGLFYTRFFNKIIGDFLTRPDAILYNNLNGYAVSRGAALNLGLTVAQNWKISAGGTWLDVFSRQVSGNSRGRAPLLFVPAFSGTFQISRTFDRLRLVADLTGSVYSPMHLPVVPFDFRPSRSPWFSLVNFQLTRRLKGDTEIFSGVKNLLNFIPRHPILRPFDPFDRRTGEDNPNGYVFDPSYSYAPLQGIRFFAGIRWNLPRS